MTEREKMLSGALYDPADAELTALREKASALCKAYNETPEAEAEKRRAILDEWN
ncbi:MAG: sugar O-acetyltransferase, partial [Oscillibacter sp.]|nr:sugar O-acetyltransferase [Oscillibacter sp.]